VSRVHRGDDRLCASDRDHRERRCRDEDPAAEHRGGERERRHTGDDQQLVGGDTSGAHSRKRYPEQRMHPAAVRDKHEEGAEQADVHPSQGVDRDGELVADQPGAGADERDGNEHRGETPRRLCGRPGHECDSR
jgi:hypothetical protein